MPKILDCYLTRIFVLLVLFLSSLEVARAASPHELELRDPYVVTLQISLPEGDPTVVTVYDGGLARYEDAARRYSVGITPHVTDVMAGLVELEIYTLVSEGGEVEKVGPSETIHGMTGFRSVASIGNQPLDVKVMAVASQSGQCLTNPGSRATATSDCGSDLDGLLFQTDGCCVSCGEQTTCGCAVSTNCGKCCKCSFC